jgi:hypothetical protein
MQPPGCDSSFNISKGILQGTHSVRPIRNSQSSNVEMCTLCLLKLSLIAEAIKGSGHVSLRVHRHTVEAYSCGHTI